MPRMLSRAREYPKPSLAAIGELITPFNISG
jgi:hypothetical protein